MFCFAELLERGWTGGIKDVGERQMLEIRQPDLKHLEKKLIDRMRWNRITSAQVMDVLNLDYYTSYHIIKNLERQGILKKQIFRQASEWKFN
jgi:predicted HTH transcriptional regulator